MRVRSSFCLKQNPLILCGWKGGRTLFVDKACFAPTDVDDFDSSGKGESGMGVEDTGVPETADNIQDACVASHVGSMTVAAETGGFAPLPWQQQALLLDLFLEQLLLNPLRSSAKA